MPGEPPLPPPLTEVTTRSVSRLIKGSLRDKIAHKWESPIHPKAPGKSFKFRKWLDLNACWGGRAHNLPDKWKLWTHADFISAKSGLISWGALLYRECVMWVVKSLTPHFTGFQLQPTSSRGQSSSLTPAGHWPPKGFLDRSELIQRKKGTWLHQCPACRTAETGKLTGWGGLTKFKENKQHTVLEKVSCFPSLDFGQGQVKGRVLLFIRIWEQGLYWKKAGISLGKGGVKGTIFRYPEAFYFNYTGQGIHAGRERTGKRKLRRFS